MELQGSKENLEEQFAALVAQLNEQDLALALADMRSIAAVNSPPPTTFSAKPVTVFLNSGYGGCGMATKLGGNFAALNAGKSA